MADIIVDVVSGNTISASTTPGGVGEGVPYGGTAGQVLIKKSNTSYDTEWASNNVVLTVGFENADYICDGIADNVQIQQAIDAVGAAGGGIVLLKAGTYNISDSLTLTSLLNVTIVGEGKSSKIVCSVGKPAINMSGCTACDIRDIYVENLSTSTVGGSTNCGILISNSLDIKIDRVRGYCYGFVLFIKATGTSTTQFVEVTNCNFAGLAHNDVIGGGPSVYGAYVKDITISNNNITQDFTDGLSGTYDTAIDIVAVDHTKFTGNTTYGHIIFGNEKSPNKYSIITNNIIYPAIGHTFGSIWVVTTDSAGGVDDAHGIVVSNNTISSGNLHIEGDSANALFQTEMIITNNIVECVTDTGLYFENCTNGVVSGNIFKDFTGQAIKTIDVDYTVISNNVISDCNYGIREFSSVPPTNLTIVNNTFNTVTTPIYGISTSNIIRNNKGWVTENSGTATVTSGNTSVTVTHGLARTPAAKDLSCTPTNGMGNASKFWIDTITSTQFNINVDVDPSTDTATFAWKGIML